MDNPARIIGYQTFRAHVDEIDTLRTTHARAAWNKVIARNRQKIYVDGKQQLNRVSAYTTPEGFRFAYQRWVKDPAPGYEMVHAPTLSNPHLPDDYVESLRASYPPELVQAYLEGLFVNLTSGNVYSSYDRALNRSVECVVGNETLYVGMDFNIMFGAAIIHVLRDGVPHAVDEIHKSFDTDHTIRVLKERYPDNPIVVYPDATSKNRTASNTTETDLAKLRAAHFVIRANHANPAIKDRVAAVNAKLCNGLGVREYFINDATCPNYAAALEQQTWDNGLPDKSTGSDHPVDAGGYYICKEFPIVRPRASVSVIQGGY
jgi:hypothetical protein